MNSAQQVAQLPAPTYSARILFGVLSRLRKGRLAITTPESAHQLADLLSAESHPDRDAEKR